MPSSTSGGSRSCTSSRSAVATSTRVRATETADPRYLPAASLSAAHAERSTACRRLRYADVPDRANVATDAVLASDTLAASVRRTAVSVGLVRRRVGERSRGWPTAGPGRAAGPAPIERSRADWLATARRTSRSGLARVVRGWRRRVAAGWARRWVRDRNAPCRRPGRHARTAAGRRTRGRGTPAAARAGAGTLRRAAHRRRARRPSEPGRRRRRHCSTAGRPSRSSPATARRPPAASTTPSCARSRSGCATCASWRSAGPSYWSPIRAQGKLDAALETRIRAADSKARLEDVYLPYKPKRRTKAMIARENGLEPLADALLADPTLDPDRHGARPTSPRTSRTPPRARRRPSDPGRAVRRGRRPRRRPAGADVDAAAGWSRPSARARRPRARSSPTTSTSPSRSRGSRRTGSWRSFRGEKEEVLDVTLDPGRRRTRTSPVTRLRAHHRRRGRHPRRGPRRRRMAGRAWCAGRGAPGSCCSLQARPPACGCAPSPRRRAIAVFAANLRDLLLAAPAGTRATMGLDPGLRTGVKVAVVDATGKVVATDTIYPHEPRRDWDGRAGDADPARHRARRRAGRDRQRHRVAGDGQAGRRARRRPPRAQADEGDGQRGRRVGVLGVGLRLGRAARPGRLAARRRVHRAPAAGPARRAGQDRPEVDRRRAVPARPARVVAVALAGRRGRGRGERRRRRRQHRLGAAAAPRLGDHRGAGGPDRRAPRRPRPVPHPDRADATCPGWARRRSSSARASCASAAATTRSTSPACTRRPTRWCAGSSRRRAATSRPCSATRRSCGRSSRSSSSTTASGCRPSPTSSPSWRSPAATRARSSAPRPSPRACTRSPTCGRAWCWRAWSPTSRRSARSSTSACTRTGSCTSRRCRTTFVNDPRDVVKSGEVVRVKVLEVDEARKRISLTLRLDDEPGAAAKPDRAGPAASATDRAGPRAGRDDRAGPARDATDRARTRAGVGRVAAGRAPTAARAARGSPAAVPTAAGHRARGQQRDGRRAAPSRVRRRGQEGLTGGSAGAADPDRALRRRGVHHPPALHDLHLALRDEAARRHPGGLHQPRQPSGSTCRAASDGQIVAVRARAASRSRIAASRSPSEAVEPAPPAPGAAVAHLLPVPGPGLAPGDAPTAHRARLLVHARIVALRLRSRAAAVAGHAVRDPRESCAAVLRAAMTRRSRRSAPDAWIVERRSCAAGPFRRRVRPVWCVT